jgi:hypothetical protein
MADREHARMIARSIRPRGDQMSIGRTLGTCAIVAIVALAVAGPAAAASYETGVYEGKIYAKGDGDSKRPTTKLKLKVTKQKIKLLAAEMRLECRDRGLVEATIGGGKGKLNDGPAGAGFSIYEYERTDAYQQNYDLVGGIKGGVAKGLVGASRTYEDPYEDCTDSSALYFKAKRK